MMMTKPAILDMQSVCAFISLSESVLQKLVRDGSFPKSRLLSGRRVGWLVREVEEWVEALPVSDLPPPANTQRKVSTVNPSTLPVAPPVA